MSKPLEFEIKKIYADLRPSERKAADYYLQYQEPLERLSLAAMAQAAKISQPTVMRFVKALGFGGFKEFKYAIISKQRQGGEDPADGKLKPPYMGDYEISQQDRPEDVPGRVVAQSASYLEETLKHISPAKITQAAKLILEARRIAVYYVENSASVANDMVTKLLYLGFQCLTYSDCYLQHVSASNLEPGDVAIGISYSGYSRNTVDVMKTARRRGAATIVLTNFEDSLISRFADVLLCTENSQALYGNAIFSRTTQIALVDMIYMRIILSDFKRFTKKLDESSRIVRKQAYEEQER